MMRILRERLLGVVFVVLSAIPWHTAAAADVKIASFASFVFLPVWVAKEGGYFEREGVNPELLFFTSGTEMTAAMLSKSVDFASTMADRPMLLLDRGQQTRILIALTTVAPYSLVVPVNSKIKHGDLAALKGKKIAITQKGSATDVAVQAILRPAGIDIDKDVTLVALGTLENGIAAMKSGQVDAVILTEPATTVAVDKEKVGEILIDLRKGEGPSAASRSTFASLQATDDYINANPEVVKHVISAICKATKDLHDDPRKFLPVAKKYFPNTDQAVLERALLNEAASYGTQVTSEMIKSVSDVNLSLSVIQHNYAIDNVVVGAAYRPLWKC